MNKYAFAALMSSIPTQKIYAFVDESGQETKGALFLVSVVVTDLA